LLQQDSNSLQSNQQRCSPSRHRSSSSSHNFSSSNRRRRHSSSNSLRRNGGSEQGRGKDSNSSVMEAMAVEAKAAKDSLWAAPITPAATTVEI